MGNVFNDELIEEIKDRNSIVEVVTKYLPLKKSGQNHKGLCPFHSEKTPSFMVSDEKQFFHCFGCGEAGDVIHFVMKMENLDFVDAVRLLGEWVGIYPDENSISKQEKEEISRKNRIYEINRASAIFFYKRLMKKDDPGSEYLYKRGLNLQTIKKFGLGYVENKWESLNQYLLFKGYDQKLIHEAGLVSERKNKGGYYDRFRNRVMFPIFNTTGKVIGFGGRVMDDSTPKYLNSPETPVFNKGDHLYGLNFAKGETGKARQIIVVEGYMDVISLHEKGIKNVCASLGTALTKSQGNLLKRYADEVIIAYDADAAGQTATLRGLDVLREVGCKVKVVSLSDGKDPDEFIRKNGKVAFLKEVEDALTLVDYKIMIAKKENNLTTTEGKIGFVRSITKVLKQIKSPVEVDAYIKKIASESQISIQAIKSEIYGNNSYEKGKNVVNSQVDRNKYISRTDRYTNKYNIVPVKPTEKQGYLEAQRSLLKLMITQKDIFSKTKPIISFEDFMDKSYRKIAKIVYHLYEEYDRVSMEMILHQLNIDEIAILDEINRCVISEKNVDKALIDYANSIQKHKLLMAKMDIEKEIKQLEEVETKTQDQMVRIRELCMNYEKLIKELKKL